MPRRWAHFRVVPFVACCLLMGSGLLLMVSPLSSGAGDVIGGIVAGAGAGALVRELMQVRERRQSSQAHEALVDQLRRA